MQSDGPEQQEPVSAELRSIFGLSLAAARMERGLTLRQLGDIAGMQATHLSAVEHGRRNVTIETMQRLASALDLDVRAMLASTPD